MHTKKFNVMTVTKVNRKCAILAATKEHNV
jgi:hypothetical protein